MNDQFTLTPEQEITSLRRTITELERTSKMLVRRDLDLKAAYDELKTLDQQKSEFVSIAAHQLRTPLTSVRFALQMLRDTALPVLDATQQDVLRKAEDSINRTFTMIEDLLLVDRLEYGKVDLTKVPQSLEKFVHEIAYEYKERIADKALLVELPPETGTVLVPFDTRQLRDVVSNLIDNATKYTPKSGKVSVTLSYEAGMAHLVVADSGIGVPDTDVPNLFKKFARFENAKKVDANGTGLGLYICQKIVERHGGTLSYTHNWPAGSRFTMSLPVA